MEGSTWGAAPPARVYAAREIRWAQTGLRRCEPQVLSEDETYRRQLIGSGSWTDTAASTAKTAGAATAALSSGAALLLAAWFY
jgi:hypothetical protein